MRRPIQLIYYADCDAAMHGLHGCNTVRLHRADTHVHIFQYMSDKTEKRAKLFIDSFT